MEQAEAILPVHVTARGPHLNCLPEEAVRTSGFCVKDTLNWTLDYWHNIPEE